MFDIGFSELLLVLIISLIVLGPQRLPLAVKTVIGWTYALRSLAIVVQNEFLRELKLQKIQDDFKKVEKVCTDNLTSELTNSARKVHQTVEFKESLSNLDDSSVKTSNEAHRIYNPIIKDNQVNTEV